MTVTSDVYGAAKATHGSAADGDGLGSLHHRLLASLGDNGAERRIFTMYAKYESGFIPPRLSVSSGTGQFGYG